MRLLLLAAAALTVPSVRANVPVDSSWVPLGYGECTKPWVDTSASPPYSGANTDVLIAEGVGSGSWGDTCGFGRAANPGLAFSQMPQLYQDGFHIGLSQDLYNGRHVHDTWATAMTTSCDQSAYTESQVRNGEMCGYSCGVCFTVNGPLGSHTFLANEIADTGCCNDNGRGLNMHITMDYNDQMRQNGATRKDIQYKRVPCPTTGGVRFKFRPTLGEWWAHVYFTPLHFKIGVKAMFAKPSNAANDADSWVPMPRTWTNEFLWAPGEGYSYQSGKSFIYGDDPNQEWDFKIVSQMDEELVCIKVASWQQTQMRILMCTDAAGNALQFSDLVNTNTQSCDATDVITPCPQQNGFPQTQPGSTAQAACQSGFSGMRSRTCNAQGVWGGIDDRSCSPVVTPCPQQDGFPQTQPGSTAQVDCDPGYTGRKTRACDGNGQWGSIGDTCVPEITSCPAKDGFLETAVGTYASKACDAGFNGQKRRYCNSQGRWKNILSGGCVQIVCLAELDFPQAVADETVSIACTTGFSGMQSRTCDATGTWSDADTSQCVTQQATCSANQGFPITVAGNTAAASCDTGMSGEKTRFCNAGGAWEAVDSSACAAVCPADHPWPQSGAATVATLECGQGMQGNRTRHCQSNAMWADEVDYCMALQCAQDGSYPATVAGDTASVSCVEGFDGSWVCLNRYHRAVYN